MVDPDEILDALRACNTVAGVDAYARLAGTAVQEMHESPSMYVRAIHIRNLAAYRRWQITGEGRPSYWCSKRQRLVTGESSRSEHDR